MAALLGSNTSAIAEVCDKVRPEWSPSDGPLNQIGDFLLTFGSVPGITFIAFVAASLFLKNMWLCVLSAGLSAFAAFVVPYNWLVPSVSKGVVHISAIGEGCIIPPYLSTSLLVLICMICLFTANFQRVRKSRKL
ncbi:hypothetical protein LP7551_01244 [Roseibium album]|nr:hypothetical protein LP7551_01244 [Roseibium album]